MLLETSDQGGTIIILHTHKYLTDTINEMEHNSAKLEKVIFWYQNPPILAIILLHRHPIIRYLLVVSHTFGCQVPTPPTLVVGTQVMSCTRHCTTSVPPNILVVVVQWYTGDEKIFGMLTVNLWISSCCFAPA